MLLISIYFRIFNTQLLTPAQRNRICLEFMACGFCVRDNDSHKAHNFKNTSSLFHHIHQVHNDEPNLEFVLEILEHLSYASQLGMIK